MAAAANPLTGPDRIAIRQASWRGPFGGRSSRTRLRPVRFAVVNGGADALAIGGLRVDPLRDADGALADAELSLRVIGDDVETLPDAPTLGRAGDPPAPIHPLLAPGAALTLELGGWLPAHPGSVATTARIILAPDGGGLDIPVAIDIPAAAPWGIACMLAGLLCLAAINVLTGEGAVKTRLHDALAARSDIHAFLDANPAPQSRRGDIEAMDHSFDAAVANLSERRGISVEDHRTDDANAQLVTATAAAADLRKALTGQPRGAAEIFDLTKEWQDLQTTLGQVTAMFGAPPATPAPGLPGKLDAFLVRYRIRFVQQPMAWISNEIVGDIDRARLAYAAGEGEAARDLAVTARVWLRRSARMLNSGLLGYRGALTLAGAMANNDAAIRDRVAQDDFPADGRATVLGLLDQASGQMDGEAWLEQWGEAHRLINRARLELTRADAALLKARTDAAIAKVNAETDYSDIQRLLDDLMANPDHSLAAKQAGLGRILKLWRAHVAAVPDAAERAGFGQQIDAIAAQVDAGKMPESAGLYRTFLNDWTARSIRLSGAATDRVVHGHCIQTFADMQRDAGALEATLREHPPNPDLADWNRRFDQIRLDMQREGPDAETITPACLGPLLAISDRMIALSGDIFAAGVADADIPALTRARLARASGVASAIAVAEANKDHARALDLTVATQEDERIVGREITFTAGRLDPVWGAGVKIGVDFGDGSPPFVASAEQLRQGAAIEHTYASALTAHLTLTAAEGFKPGTIDPQGAALGEGSATILIAPSPITAAQRLADDILNLRFAVALLIALTVYYWRFQNSKKVLGANSIDYVEAFALGFVANAAAGKLPDVLGKMGGG
jgi:hypothetical protein